MELIIKKTHNASNDDVDEVDTFFMDDDTEENELGEEDEIENDNKESSDGMNDDVEEL